MMSDQMDQSIQTALEQLHTERTRIEGAITKLESFVSNLIESASQSLARKEPGYAQSTPYRRSRDGWTHEAREAASNRMKHYWSQRREEAASKGETPKNPRKRIRHIGPPVIRERSREGWTPEARQAASERMRAYWNNRNKDESKSHLSSKPHTP